MYCQCKGLQECKLAHECLLKNVTLSLEKPKVNDQFPQLEALAFS